MKYLNLKQIHKWQNTLDAINKDCNRTWLIARCGVNDDILSFRVDGFAMMKFQVTNKGNLKVIINHCTDNQYPENAAFQFANFAVGKIVSLEKFAKYIRAWVAISNLRAQLGSVTKPHSYDKLIFNPHKNLIQWHNSNGWWGLDLGEDSLLRLEGQAPGYYWGYRSIKRHATK